MGRAKRHHYVPKALQKRFADKTGKVWYCERASLDEGFSRIEHRNRNSCFKKRNLFTILEGVDKPSDKVETDFYGPIDNHFSVLLDEILPSLEAGTVPKFSSAELNFLNSLVAVLFKRSIDTVSLIDEQEIGDEIRAGILTDFQFVDSTESTNEEISERVPDAKSLGRQARVGAQISESAEIMRELERYKVVFVRPERKSSFILGSKMIHRIENEFSGSMDSNIIEYWMPVSPKFSMVWINKKSKIGGIQDFRQQWVRDFNEWVFSQSLAVASHAPKILISLLNSR